MPAQIIATEPTIEKPGKAVAKEVDDVAITGLAMQRTKTKGPSCRETEPPGCLRWDAAAVGIIFGLFVAFTAAQLWQ